MVALAHAKVTGPRLEALVEPLVPQPHLRVQGESPRHPPATGGRALLPVVHVVLLEGAGGAEAAHTRQPDGFLDRGRGCPVDVEPGPDLGLVWPPRVPDPERARGGAEHR